LVDMSKAVATEYAPQGVRVVTVSPGPVNTRMWLGPDGAAHHAALIQGVSTDDVVAQETATIPSDGSRARKRSRSASPSSLHRWRWRSPGSTSWSTAGSVRSFDAASSGRPPDAPPAAVASTTRARPSRRLVSPARGSTRWPPRPQRLRPSAHSRAVESSCHAEHLRRVRRCVLRPQCAWSRPKSERTHRTPSVDLLHHLSIPEGLNGRPRTRRGPRPSSASEGPFCAIGEVARRSRCTLCARKPMESLGFS
jgi:hypothetical protein